MDDQADSRTSKSTSNGSSSSSSSSTSSSHSRSEAVTKQTQQAKHSRQYRWGPFWLARLHPKGRPQRGCGATCKQHLNEGDGPRIVCKSSMNRAKMSNREAEARMKMWLLIGQTIDPNDPDARQQHMDMGKDLHLFELWDEALLENLL